MLVYEYVDNGNLDQWLHGDVGDVSPLTWDIRMNIILGTAKGYSNSWSRFNSVCVIELMDAIAHETFCTFGNYILL